MEIKIVHFGVKYPLVISRNATVIQLKGLIKDRFGFSVEEQILSFNQQVLGNNQEVLRNYEISNRSEINITVKDVVYILAPKKEDEEEQKQERYKLLVNENMRVEDLKQMVACKYGVDIMDKGLHKHGVEGAICNHAFLWAYAISDGTELYFE